MLTFGLAVMSAIARESVGADNNNVPSK